MDCRLAIVGAALNTIDRGLSVKTKHTAVLGSKTWAFLVSALQVGTTIGEQALDSLEVRRSAARGDRPRELCYGGLVALRLIPKHGYSVERLDELVCAAIK
jgi:hypothetical protein